MHDAQILVSMGKKNASWTQARLTVLAVGLAGEA